MEGKDSKDSIGSDGNTTVSPHAPGPTRFAGAVDTLRRKSKNGSEKGGTAGTAGAERSRDPEKDFIQLNRMKDPKETKEATPSSHALSAKRMSVVAVATVPLKSGDPQKSPSSAPRGQAPPAPMPNMQTKRQSFAPIAQDAGDGGERFDRSERKEGTSRAHSPASSLASSSQSLSDSASDSDSDEASETQDDQPSSMDGPRRWTGNSEWPIDFRRPSLAAVAGTTAAPATAPLETFRRPSIVPSSPAVPLRRLSFVAATATSNGPLPIQQSQQPLPGMGGPRRDSVSIGVPGRRQSISTSASSLPPLILTNSEAEQLSGQVSTPPPSSPLHAAATRRGSIINSVGDASFPSPQRRPSATSADRRASTFSTTGFSDRRASTFSTTAADRRASILSTSDTADLVPGTITDGTSKRSSVAAPIPESREPFDSMEEVDGGMRDAPPSSSEESNISGPVSATISTLKRGIASIRRRSSLMSASPTSVSRRPSAAPAMSSSSSSSTALPNSRQRSSSVPAAPPTVLITSDSSPIPLDKVGIVPTQGSLPPGGTGQQDHQRPLEGHARDSSTGLPPENAWAEIPPSVAGTIGVKIDVVPESDETPIAPAWAAPISPAIVPLLPNIIPISTTTPPPTQPIGVKDLRRATTPIVPLRFTPAIAQSLESITSRTRAAILALRKNLAPSAVAMGGTGEAQTLLGTQKTDMDDTVHTFRPVLALFFQLCAKAVPVKGRRTWLKDESSLGSLESSRESESMGEMREGGEDDDGDDDGEEHHDPADPKVLTDALRDVFVSFLGVDVSKGEQRVLEALYGGKGWVSVRDVVIGVGGGLNKRRLEVVRDAYEVLLEKSNAGLGMVTFKEARSHFNPLEHPRVRTGELAAEGPLAEFVDFFATEEDVMRGGLVRSVRSALERGSMTTGSQRAGTAANDLAALASTSGSAVRTEVKEPEGDGKVLYVATRGTIELIEWEYYWGIHSAQIDSDEYFERLLFGVWKEINLEAKTRARDAWAAEVPNMSRPSTPVSALASAGTRGSRDEVKRSIDGAIAGAAARSHSRAGSKMLLAEENEPEQDGHKHLYDFETRRRLAQRLRRMSYIISDPRTYRHALDIALLPITPPVVFSAETSLVKSTVHQILSNLYTLFPSPPSISSEASSRPSKPLNGVSSSGLDLRGPAAPHTAFSPSLDPATFEQVWRRCKRDVEKVTTASELEWVCRETLLKEVGFAEYLIFARTVKRE